MSAWTYIIGAMRVDTYQEVDDIVPYHWVSHGFTV